MSKWNSDSALRVLDLLEVSLREKQFTRRHLAEKAGLRAASTVQTHLNALRDGGCITLAGRGAPEITSHGRLILAAWRVSKERGKTGWTAVATIHRGVTQDALRRAASTPGVSIRIVPPEGGGR